MGKAFFPFLCEEMFMNRQCLLAVVAGLAIGSCGLAFAAEPSSNNSSDNEFAGKIVYVQMSSNENYVLENVSVKFIGRGGEQFLAGRGVRRSDTANSQREWWQGLPVRLNLRFVESYFPMSPEQWKNVNEK
jgi:hypothetical protein